MKKFVLLSVFDRVNGIYSTPRLFSENQAANFRTISYLMKQGRDEDYCIFVDDKDLYQIGTFDPESGELLADLKFIIHLKELSDCEKEAISNE